MLRARRGSWNSAHSWESWALMGLRAQSMSGLSASLSPTWCSQCVKFTCLPSVLFISNRAFRIPSWTVSGYREWYAASSDVWAKLGLRDSQIQIRLCCLSSRPYISASTITSCFGWRATWLILVFFIWQSSLYLIWAVSPLTFIWVWQTSLLTCMMLPLVFAFVSRPQKLILFERVVWSTSAKAILHFAQSTHLWPIY